MTQQSLYPKQSCQNASANSLYLRLSNRNASGTIIPKTVGQKCLSKYCTQNTVMCLGIGTPKCNKFSIVPNVKLIIFRCPRIWAHYSLIIMCSNIGTPKIINFPFGTNGKLMVLGVPIFRHFRVVRWESLSRYTKTYRNIAQNCLAEMPQKVMYPKQSSRN